MGKGERVCLASPSPLRQASDNVPTVKEFRTVPNPGRSAGAVNNSASVQGDEDYKDKDKYWYTYNNDGGCAASSDGI